jgi:uncharacterized membrane protein YebE (DUF533 family)
VLESGRVSLARCVPKKSADSEGNMDWVTRQRLADELGEAEADYQAALVLRRELPSEISRQLLVRARQRLEAAERWYAREKTLARTSS